MTLVRFISFVITHPSVQLEIHNAVQFTFKAQQETTSMGSNASINIM